MVIQNLPKDNLIKCLSQKIPKMNNKKIICTNHQYCADKTDCPHSRLHNATQFCEGHCTLVDKYSMCESINFIRKQKLEKLNQNYEV